MSEPKAIILSIGTELTEGRIGDGHGRFLSSELSLRGFSVLRMEQIADGPVIRDRLKAASREADLIVLTGGLGPTSDDITRDYIAELFRLSLVFDQRLWESIKKRVPRLCGASNKRQAMIPEGFTALDNPNGTAPGLYGEGNGLHLFALPGPPRELQPMAIQKLFPMIEALFPIELPGLDESSVFLIGESRLEEACKRIQASQEEFSSLFWGTRVQERKISLYLRGGSAALRERFLTLLRAEMGPELIRDGDVEAEDLLSQLLILRKKRFACAESCTGGMLGTVLTSIPGASEWFDGSCVSYSNRWKRDLLGVPDQLLQEYGAVSRECVIAMAEGVVRNTAADCVCSISGIAGPGGGSEEKPVGTVYFGLAGKERESMALRFVFGYSRDSVRRRAVVAACLLSEIYIGGGSPLDICRHWQYS